MDLQLEIIKFATTLIRVDEIKAVWKATHVGHLSVGFYTKKHCGVMLIPQLKGETRSGVVYTSMCN